LTFSIELVASTSSATASPSSGDDKKTKYSSAKTEHSFCMSLSETVRPSLSSFQAKTRKPFRVVLIESAASTSRAMVFPVRSCHGIRIPLRRQRTTKWRVHSYWMLHQSERLRPTASSLLARTERCLSGQIPHFSGISSVLKVLIELVASTSRKMAFLIMVLQNLQKDEGNHLLEESTSCPKRAWSF
jgi:hypothetical protein